LISFVRHGTENCLQKYLQFTVRLAYRQIYFSSLNVQRPVLLIAETARRSKDWMSRTLQSQSCIRIYGWLNSNLVVHGIAGMANGIHLEVDFWGIFCPAGMVRCTDERKFCRGRANHRCCL